MRKLLAANFSRLWRDKAFWAILLLVFAGSLINIVSGARSYHAMLDSGYARATEDYYFNLAPVMGAAFAVFAGLFLGTEYADGTLRNKLIVGHRRDFVFLSGFTVCSAASLAFLAAWLIAGSLGFMLMGPMEMGLSGFAVYAAIAAAFTVSFSAIYTLIGNLSSNKVMTVIFSIAVFLVLALAASALYDRLSVPEINEGLAFINGELVDIEPTPNPLYLSGVRRTVCEYILDFLPSGQALLMNEAAIEHPARELISSGVLTAVALLAGCAAFRRKDIK